MDNTSTPPPPLPCKYKPSCRGIIYRYVTGVCVTVKIQVRSLFRLDV